MRQKDNLSEELQLQKARDEISQLRKEREELILARGTGPPYSDRERLQSENRELSRQLRQQQDQIAELTATVQALQDQASKDMRSIDAGASQPGNDHAKLESAFDTQEKECASLRQQLLSETEKYEALDRCRNEEREQLRAKIRAALQTTPGAAVKEPIESQQHPSHDGTVANDAAVPRRAPNGYSSELSTGPPASPAFLGTLGSSAAGSSVLASTATSSFSRASELPAPKNSTSSSELHDDAGNNIDLLALQERMSAQTSKLDDIQRRLDHQREVWKADRSPHTQKAGHAALPDIRGPK